ncbi:MAG TPA: hypothetical protein DEP84_33120 [Chloroflexi bacterium]|nr:hypothetical protein [Chloroflexota bacterium]
MGGMGGSVAIEVALYSPHLLSRCDHSQLFVRENTRQGVAGARNGDVRSLGSLTTWLALRALLSGEVISQWGFSSFLSI